MKHTITAVKNNKFRLKYFLLLLIIILGSYMVFLVPEAVESWIPVVNTVTPQKKEYCKSVTGNGTIENISQEDVLMDVPVVIKSFMVNSGDKITAGQVLGTIDKEQTVALFSTVAEQSKQYSGLDIALAEANIPSEITSPVSGVISSLCSKGTLVAQGEPIATIVQQSSLVLTAAVGESDIATVDVGQKVDIKGAAFKDGTYTGVVKQISPTARKQYAGTVQETVVDVVIAIDNADDNLRAGYTAQAVIYTTPQQTLLTLPYSVICQDDTGEYVYIYRNGNSIRRDIMTGVELSEGAEVIDGIYEGDEVIANPAVVSANAVVIKQKSGE